MSVFAFDAVTLISETKARFEAWKGNDDVVVFPVVCDMHPEYADANGYPRDPRSHLPIVMSAAESFGADFIAVLGDLGLQTGQWGYGRVSEDAHAVLESFLTAFEKSPVPVLFTMGNDDYFYSNPRKDVLDIGVKDVAAKLNSGLKDAVYLDVDSKDIGYLDLSRQKCRVLFLNSSETRTGLVRYGMSTNQLDFARSAMKSMPEDYKLIVLSHKSFCDEFKWILSNPPPKSYEGDDEMMKAVSDFQSERGAVAFCMSGDSHVDFDYCWNDVNWVSSQSLAPHIAIRAGDSAPKWGHRAEHQYFDFAETTLIDVVAVKPGKGQVRIFRIGTGGAARDRLLAFGKTRDPGFLQGEDVPQNIEPYSTAIPQWAKDSIAAAKARFNVWKGNDEVFSFPIITDSHSGEPDLPAVPNWRDTKMHALIAQQVTRDFGCDFLAHLGDIGIERNRHFAFEGFGTEFTRKRMMSELRLFAGFEMPALFVTGNHDCHARLDGLPYAQSCAYARYMNAGADKRGMKLITSPNRDYGYWDVDAKRIRIVFANTSEIHNYGLLQSQVDFIQKTLWTTPKGWSVIFISHLPPNKHVALPKAAWDNAKWKTGQHELMTVLERFAKDKPNECKLVGAIAGDYHEQIFLEENGVTTFVSQGLGPGTGREHLDPNGLSRFWQIDPGKETLIDVVAVKPTSGEVRTFRVGAGGKSAEISWKF